MIDLWNTVNKDMQIATKVELMNWIVLLLYQQYFFFSHLIKGVLQLVLFPRFHAIPIGQLSISETN